MHTRPIRRMDILSLLVGDYSNNCFSEDTKKYLRSGPSRSASHDDPINPRQRAVEIGDAILPSGSHLSRRLFSPLTRFMDKITLHTPLLLGSDLSPDDLFLDFPVSGHHQRG